MNLKYKYWYFTSAIPRNICDQILELGLTSMYERKQQFGDQAISGSVGGWKQKQHGMEETAIPLSSTVDDLTKQGIDHNNTYIRDSNVTFLSNPELYDIVWPFIREANERAGWNFEWDYTEDFQFTKYSKDQFYGWHTDSSDQPFRKFNPEVDAIHKNPDGTPYLDQWGNPMPEDHDASTNPKMIGKIRKLSATISLNDSAEYEGGNLEFDLGPHRPDRYHTCTEIRPKGSIVVFPSHIYHRVTPVTSGTRYSLVCWNLGAPFR